MKYIDIIITKCPINEDIILSAYASRLSYKNKTITLFTDDLKLLSKLVLHGDDEAKSLRGL